MVEKLRAKPIKEQMEQEIKERAARLEKAGKAPKLASIRVGDDPATVSYEIGLSKAFTRLGLAYECLSFPGDIKEDDLISAVKAVGDDDDISGILLLMPLPDHLNEERVIETIPPIKDVDGVRLDQLGRVLAYNHEGFHNCAIASVLAFLDFYNIDVYGKRVMLLGAGRLVNRPLSMLLLERKATVLLTNTKTKDPASLAQEADVIVTSMGNPNVITEDFLREDQVVIDVGTSFAKGKIEGDFPVELTDSVAAYTPTPGGVSGLTTTILALHVVEARERMQEKTIEK